MYGQSGFKLAQHAKRAQALGRLPPYQLEVVRDVVREISVLDSKAASVLDSFEGSFDPASDPSTACTLLIDHLGMRRNKRCLLAYHRTRAFKLEKLCWDGQATPSPHKAPQQGQQAHPDSVASDINPLSHEEEDFTERYSELLAKYKGRWTDIDLTGSMEPPHDIFIDVRVLKDVGEIQTEYGAITLTKNSQHYVRQGDIEHLIASGYLQRIK